MAAFDQQQKWSQMLKDEQLSKFELILAKYCRICSESDCRYMSEKNIHNILDDVPSQEKDNLNITAQEQEKLFQFIANVRQSLNQPANDSSNRPSLNTSRDLGNTPASTSDNQSIVSLDLNNIDNTDDEKQRLVNNNNNYTKPTPEERQKMMKKYLRSEKFKDFLKSLGLTLILAEGSVVAINFSFGQVPVDHIINSVDKITDVLDSNNIGASVIPFCGSIAYIIMGIIESIIAYGKYKCGKYDKDDEENNKVKFKSKLKEIWVTNLIGCLGAAISGVVIIGLAAAVMATIWHILLSIAASVLIGYLAKTAVKNWKYGGTKVRTLMEAIEDFHIRGDVKKDKFDKILRELDCTLERRLQDAKRNYDDNKKLAKRQDLIFIRYEMLIQLCEPDKKDLQKKVRKFLLAK